jgi:hypothetical protein
VTLEPTVANAFVAGYKGLLLQIGVGGRPPKSSNVLSVLASARRQLTETPGLLDKALVKLRARSEGVDEEIVRAIRTLRVNNWVFLRDTKAYSIFVHPSEETAFDVLRLTQSVRDIAGALGVVIETGIVRFTGRFVCDGWSLVSFISGPTIARATVVCTVRQSLKGASMCATRPNHRMNRIRAKREAWGEVLK